MRINGDYFTDSKNQPDKGYMVILLIETYMIKGNVRIYSMIVL